MDMSDLPQDDPFADPIQPAPQPPAQGAGGNYGTTPAQGQQGGTEPTPTGPTKKRVLVTNIETKQGNYGPYIFFRGSGLKMGCFKKDLIALLQTAQDTAKEIEVEYVAKQNGQYTNYNVTWVEGAVPRQGSGKWGGGKMFSDKQAAAFIAGHILAGQYNDNDFVAIFNKIHTLIKE